MSRSPNSSATLQLAGLLEGRIPPTPDFPERLERFEQEAQAAGLHLKLELDGGRFGLLGDNVARAWPDLAPEPEQDLAERIEDLLFAFPDRSNLYSTLRSTTTRGISRTRTLFAMRPDGRIERVEERDVLDQPVALKTAPSRLRAAAPLALTVLGLGGAFAFDVLGVRSQVRAIYSPFEPWMIHAIDLEDFGGTIELGGFQVQGTPAQATMSLRRGPEFPAGSRAELLSEPEAFSTLEERLAIEALVRGRARLVGIRPDGSLTEEISLSIDGLFENGLTELVLPRERLRGAARLRLTW